MSRTGVYERIKKLENSEYIKRSVEESLSQVYLLDEIMETYVTRCIFDVILKVVVPNPDTFNDFVTKKLSTPHISKIQSSFVICYIKQSTVLHF